MSGDNALNTGIDLVSHDVRAEILRTLATEMRARPRDAGLRFTELRERVGHDDPGNFNYHLKRLVGPFVEKTEDGYALSDIGHHFISVLQSGQFDPDRHYELPEAETECLLCDSPATVRYEDGSLRTRCENDHDTALNAGPDLVDSHSVADALNIATRRTLLQAKSAIDDVCPYCEGEATGGATRISDGHEPVLYEWTCQSCGALLQISAGGSVIFHPAVVSFCYRRGVDVFQQTWQVLAEYISPATVCSEDPLRTRVTVSLNNEQLIVSIDESASVVETALMV